MRYVKWTDRVKETLNTHKATVIAVVIAIAVAAAISGGMIHELAPSKSTHNADMTRLDGEMSAMTNHVVGLTNDVEDIVALGPLATEDDLVTIGNQTVGNAFNISALQTRVGTAEDRIQEAREDIANLPSSPPEGYLTGTFGNYTLHAKCSTAGNFTANINLVYSTPISVGNATTQDEVLDAFYSSINWAATSVPDYVCDLTCNENASTWGISQVWFNIGTFELVANTEKAVAIPFGGLNSTYEPGFAYVEVFPVLK